MLDGMNEPNPQNQETIRLHENESADIGDFASDRSSIAMLSARQYIQNDIAYWTSYRKEHLSVDNDSVIFANKMLMVYNHLNGMMNEQALLSSTQYRAVQNMVEAVVLTNSTSTLNTSGEGPLLLLPIATYINSCTG